ncbi:hypothetical protein VK792_03460 [Mesobacterium sp. TK19101]|uniref:Uncharacterized protein n=1 Tax=Mesobacterium hydrothermale TaxID=3111907 RepID=A0ABU6HGV2_9RHOB|nr:hypothetical protein [Mesobacterium sp. TK19101]MEC3860330.1 hypothetical protein [Mesobacterium sp. TK19101]
MRFGDTADLVKNGAGLLQRGPLALIFAEDEVELDGTLRHHLKQGFGQVIVFAPKDLPCPEMPGVARVDLAPTGPDAVAQAVTQVNDAAAGHWVYFGFNAEYLFYPFSETRRVSEMLAFHAEERRDAMVCFVIDLYAPDLSSHPDAVNPQEAWLDKASYYALERLGDNKHPKERQLDFFGGLRWRFEEHVPENRRRIDRVALFRAEKGLQLRPDFTLSDEERNTYACPWHNNLTAAVASFRTAKALKCNPMSRKAIDSFIWPGSVRFDWSSRQLMDLGLMEPGQWF